MADRRHKDGNWQIADDQGVVRSWEEVQVSILMDIRDELKIVRQRLSVLECQNFLDIPMILRKIRSNTMKPRPRKPRVAGRPKLRVVR